MTRAFDLIAASLGLIVLSPVLILLGLVIRLGDGGPALFTHRRVGRGGKVFPMRKFRSMTVANAGPGLTVGADRRITPIGRILRKTKFDEFPQLINVVLGQMSLVGPRPEIEAYVKLYRPDQRAVLDLRPGITDPASFAFYDEAEMLARQSEPHRFYEEVLMPEKIRINLEYARRRTFRRDLFLIFATVLKGFGVHFDVLSVFRITPPDPAVFG